MKNGTWLGGPFAEKDKWCVALDWGNFKLPDDNCDIYKQHEQISYMLKSYIEIQKIKLGRKKLNFPWDVKEEPKEKGKLKSFFKKITKKA